MLCLKLSKVVVVVISSAGQKGVDADNPTLHVQCFVHVREATGVSMRRQGKLYRLMKMTMMKMMTIRYGTLLIIPIMRSTIKFTPIYESILWTFLNLTNIMYYWPHVLYLKYTKFILLCQQCEQNARTIDTYLCSQI